MDGSTYTISGGSYLNATLRPDRYVLELRFGHSSYAFTTTLEFRNPDGFPGGPLTSRELIAGNETTGHFSFIASPWNPDAPGSWDAFGQPDSALLSASPVPEPSHSALLVCGLLILLARFASLGWRKRP
ncbi:hypothetical protein [Pseudoduganella sp. GCM10020061]|uniref:hypothetical protein n=1 Tax=Pseudoduganella sp. GCM10020061 TaxID=3317345 RepID=UPI003627B65D